jgi:hypothetical protein
MAARPRRRSRSLSLLVLGPALAGAFAFSPVAAQTSSRSEHVQLGFDVRKDLELREGDASRICNPFDPDACLETIAWEATFASTEKLNGGVALDVRLGATFGIAYDRSALVPGGVVPISLSLLPTNDDGNELEVHAPGVAWASLRVAGVPWGTIEDEASFLDVTGDFSVPYGSTEPLVLQAAGEPLEWVVDLPDPLGTVTFLSLHAAGSLTVKGVGPGAQPGLGGTTAVLSVAGGSLVTPVDPVIEWHAGGNVAASVQLPATGAPVTVVLGPVVHWLEASADLDLFVKFFDILPTRYPFYPMALASDFEAAGLHELVALGMGRAVVDGTGDSERATALFQAIFAQADANRIPIPLLVDRAAEEHELGAISFTIDPDADDDGLLDGTEIAAGTNPDDADSDDDGLADGREAGLGTNPLDADSDDDRLPDGAEVDGHGTSAVLADTDGDTLSDGAEILDHGTSPLKKDTDDDRLPDPVELATAHGALDPDSDDDALPDGGDVEFVQNPVRAAAASAFKSSGQRAALLDRLDEVEAALLGGDRNAALKMLANVRRTMDGCGAAADSTDTITDCDVQRAIRAYLDLLAANLG